MANNHYDFSCFDSDISFVKIKTQKVEEVIEKRYIFYYMINISNQNLEKYFSVIIQNNLENKGKGIKDISSTPHIIVGIGNDAIRLTGDACFNFNKALYEILKNHEMDNTFIIEELKELLIEFFQDEKIGKISLRSKTIKKLVSKFLIFLDKQLQENKNKKYSVIFPIENLKISNNKWELGRVAFLSYDECKKIIDSARIEKEPLFFKEANKNSIFALAEARGSNKKAEEKAVNKVDEVIDILRLYFTNWQNHARAQIGKRGELFIFNRELLSFSKGKMFHSIGWAGAGYPIACEISLGILDIFELYKFSKVDTILKKDIEKRNTFERRLIETIRWFGYGVVSSNNNHRVIMYMTAMETILGTKDSETHKDKSIGDAIGEKGAFLLGYNLETRLDIKKRLKRLYRHRSEILHQGKLEDNEAMVFELEKLTSGILLRLIDLSTELNSMKEFDNYIQKQLFSTPLDRKNPSSSK